MVAHDVLIIGSGHLAFRLKNYLGGKGFTVMHSTTEAINEHAEPGSFMEALEAFMEEINTGSLAMIYLIDEMDEKNLHLIIALNSLRPGIPITASLFNENLIPHLTAEKNNLVILNPAKIAAPFFVNAVYQDLERKIIPKPGTTKIIKNISQRDTLIYKMLFAFTMLGVMGVLFFHFYEKLDWLDSIYFVVVTVTTVGYGDISLLHSDAISKIVVIFLILDSTFLIWMIFSLTIDQFLKKRIRLALGRKKYNLTNHIILCGLGRLGYFIAEELLKNKEKLIIIEQNESSNHIDYFRHLGAEVYIGDGRLSKVLNDVNVSRAKALISVVNNDSVNLEMGLNGRSYNSALRLILRIHDEKMTGKIREYLNIYLALSASAIADEKFYEVLKVKQSLN
jgi:voltage-gated potassium channel Kch